MRFLDGRAAEEEIFHLSFDIHGFKFEVQLSTALRSVGATCL